jgi:hypothetical protein
MYKKSVSVGFTVDHFQDFTPLQIIRGMKWLGIDFFELTPSIFNDVNALPRICKMETALHLPILESDGYDFSCPSKLREINTLIQNINTFRGDLCIHHVIAHPPEIDHDTKIKVDEKFWLKNLEQLYVPVYLENIPSYSPALFEAVYTRTRNFLKEQLHGMCFDAAHYYLSGMDPVEQYQQLEKLIGCIHLSDCKPDDDAHMPFRSGGVLPIEQILAVVGKTGYRGYVTLEIKPDSMQQVKAFFDSYLLTLKHLNYKKYLVARIRFCFLKPIINHFSKSIS